MFQIFVASYVMTSSISTLLPWISLTTYNLNVLPEFPIKILCVDATKLSRIDYNGNNDVVNDQFIIRAEEITQMGQPGKILKMINKICKMKMLENN